ncbi:SpoIIE family protein phosphatase [Streptomyces griseoviridis]|uniref:SpoIIE family protein phosphatase n=1 Tax=Streptomyces griseoviridis TaxID=45398 RepID=UPI003417B51E
MGAQEERSGTRQRFDVADAAPLLLDARGTVTSWTRGAERLLGRPAAEAVGTPVAAFLAPADAARLPELAERCRTDGDWAGPLTALRADGRPVRVMARVTRAVEPDGAVRWLVLLSDLACGPGWDLSRTVLEQMLTRSPVGIAVVDTGLRFVWSNPALEQFGGGPPGQRLGRRLAEIQPGLDIDGIEAQMRRVLATGEPVVGYEHVGHPRSAPHRETAHLLSFTRLEDEHGRPTGVCYTVVDVTERHRARQRLALLDRAGERIGRTLDIEGTAQELSDVAVPDFADLVTVDLLAWVLRGGEPAPPPEGPERPVLRRAGHRSVDPERGPDGAARDVAEAAFVDIGAEARYLAGSPPLIALASGRAWRQERLDPTAPEWASRAPGARAVTFRDLGLHSAMVVPIRARGVTLGVTAFFRRGRQDPFDADDLHLAEDLVSRAAVCVDNARRYTRERDAALALQRSLLPRRLPEQDAVEVTACYRPADELTGLGGDWYDLIPLSGARVALVVGEVPGHGIDASAAMGRLRTAVRTLAALDLPPDEILAHLDDLVGRTAQEEGVRPDPEGDSYGDSMQAVGSGCVYVVYDPVDGHCAMAAAGHPAPAVVRPDGTVRFVELPQGPPLGAGGPPFEAVELALDAGSTLVLHTDGLLADGDHAEDDGGDGDGHAEDDGGEGGDAGRERLRRALERATGSFDRRGEAVIDALVPAHPHDDVALLMARTRLLGADQVADWELTSDPAIVAVARKAAARQLTEWDLEELAFTTELVVSELVTNAMRHAGGPIRLRLIRDRALICEVTDRGATAPHLRHPRTTDEGGRGLLLVSQFTQRWGTRYSPEGKVIWAEQSLAGPPE